MGIINTIGTFIMVIALLGVVTASNLGAVALPDPVARVSAARTASRRGANRKKSRQESPHSRSDNRSQNEAGNVIGRRIAGAITSIGSSQPRGGGAMYQALVASGAVRDESRTAVYVNNDSAVVFGNRIARKIARLLNGNPNGIDARGRVLKASRSQVSVVGVSRIMESPEFVRFPRINLMGEHTTETDVIVKVRKNWMLEVERTLEVPTSGYCVRCNVKVYRRNVREVHIDRWGLGTYRGDELTRWNLPANATEGECVNCGLEVPRFGPKLFETVTMRDYNAGVAPVQGPRPPAPKKEKSPDAVHMNPYGYCMSCRETVGRRNIRLVTLRPDIIAGVKRLEDDQEARLCSTSR